MKTGALDDTVRGWFAGDFPQAVYRTRDFEASVKYDKAGDKYEKHTHKIATEITVVISGRLRFNDRICCKNDILVIEPGEAADCEALEDSISVVIKAPGVPGDKFYFDSIKQV